jgi:hypothetical protein
LPYGDMSRIDCEFDQVQFGEQELNHEMMRFVGNFAASGNPNQGPYTPKGLGAPRTQQAQQAQQAQQPQQAHQQENKKRWPLYSEANVTLWLVADAASAIAGEHGMKPITSYKHRDCAFWAGLASAGEERGSIISA